MATLSLHHVKKQFGKTEVIHGVSVEVADGEFIVIVGPSGCGKSTLLRLVAGLETVNEGEVRINDRVVNNLEPMDRDIAMVFQNYALYPHMSVAQNMAYGLKIAGMAKSDIKKKVRETAKLLQLEPFLQRKPRELSGGQRQRVAMGRAIVREPAVFLFDEPLSNLDAKLRVQMRVEIKQLQAKLGVTSLYVTHDQVEAMTMADRMIVMNAGIAEQIGTPLDVYENPATLFAAQFIGSPAMNVFSGSVFLGNVELSNGTTLDYAGSHQGSALVGIRPEHIELDENGPLEVRITLTEPLGANTLIYGTFVQSDETITVCLPGVFRDSKTDDICRFRIDAQHIHLFDEKTAQRITN